MANRPTIQDVARQAGVGVGTVSRVLNDNPNVSQATRRRVLQAIDELGYSRHEVARKLSVGKTFTIGVVVPFFTRPAFVEYLRGIENGLAATEYDLTIYNVETVQRRDWLLQSVPRRGRVDGMLLIALAPTSAELALFQRTNLPVILLDSYSDRLPTLRMDDVEGGRLATEHLLAFGHRRIAYIGDAFDSEFRFTSSRDRFEGYRQALSAEGIALRQEYCRMGEHGRRQAYAMARELLRLPEPPTALFAFSDTHAFGAMEAARSLGVSIPDHLSLIGYDDVEVSEHIGLTTIHQPLFDLGRRSVELLLARIHQPDTPLPEPLHDFKLYLVERNTTGPPLEPG